MCTIFTYGVKTSNGKRNEDKRVGEMVMQFGTLGWEKWQLLTNARWTKRWKSRQEVFSIYVQRGRSKHGETNDSSFVHRGSVVDPWNVETWPHFDLREIRCEELCRLAPSPSLSREKGQARRRFRWSWEEGMIWVLCKKYRWLNINLWNQAGRRMCN